MLILKPKGVMKNVVQTANYFTFKTEAKIL